MKESRRRVIVFIFVLFVFSALPVKAAYYSFENVRDNYRTPLISAGLSAACYDNGTGIISINERGDILLSMGGPYCNNNDLHVYSNGILKNITNGQFNSVGPYVMNNVGHVAFISWENTFTYPPRGGQTTSGHIYLYDGITTSLRVSQNMLYGNYIGGGNVGLAINDLDQIAFTASFAGYGYWWNNVYLYTNETGAINSITNSAYRIYWLNGLNNQGKAIFHGTGSYFDDDAGRENIYVYDGSTILNITNLPRGVKAGVVDYNNMGDVVWLLGGPFGCNTYNFDGINTVEITKSDGLSFCDSGGINDNRTKVFTAGNELLYCEEINCNTLLTDFPSTTGFDRPDINNSGKIIVSASTPDGSILPSGQYIGTLQPFATTSLIVSRIAEKEAEITWDTEVPSSSRVEYGTADSLGSVIESPSLTTSHSIILTGLQPFTKYYFRVVSVDEVGNKSVSSKGLFKTLDIDLPNTTSIVTGTHGNDGWYISDVQINLSATDMTSGVKEIHYSINQEAENIVSGDSTVISLTIEGTYTIIYYAVDNAGNIEDTKTITIKVDNVPPSLNLSVTPDNLWPPNGRMVDITISGGVSDSLTGVSSLAFTVIDEYGIIQPTVPDFNTTIKLQAWREETDKDGRRYTITAVATDVAGGKSTVSAFVLVLHDKR